MERNLSELDLFYNDSSVLITGGNGFLGKFLVKTLLWNFEVAKIYLLLRTKKHETPEKRLKTMLSDQLFDDIREKDPEILDKIVVIPADYLASEIMSEGNLVKIINEVNIVFHVLATIKFNESLQDAVEVNMLITQKIVKIVNQMKKLKSFIHVSTLFSNCNQSSADEVIYEHAIDYKQLITLAKLFNGIENEKSVKISFDHDFPNTYSLTKHFAEKLVVDQVENIPVGIYRPPIVTSSYKHLPGWTDNINGFSGVIVSMAKGFSHCWLGDEHNTANIAPVDYVTNAMIAATWEVSENFKESQKKHKKFEIPIYNYILEENNITYGKLISMIPEGFDAPFEESFYFFSCIKTKWKYLFQMLNFVFSIIPAFAADLLTKLQCKKGKFLKISRKIEEFYLVLSYFTINKFKFGSENLRNLIEKVEKMENFNQDLKFDMRDIDWKNFMKTHQRGLKKYFFKESLDEKKLEELRKNYQRLENYGFFANDVINYERSLWQNDKERRLEENDVICEKPKDNSLNLI